MIRAPYGRLTICAVEADHPAVRIVCADMSEGQRREIAASRPGVTPAEIADDIARLPACDREHMLKLVDEDGAPRAIILAVMCEQRRVALAMVTTRSWQGRIPVPLYLWFARVFLPGLDREDISAAIVEVIRFADTPPRAHDWLRRLGFVEARTERLRLAAADRVTFRRLHPRLRSTPDRKAS